jgi:putative glutamine amidotransferase
MRRPIIGITIDTSDTAKAYESPVTYAKAVENAGGLPLLIPYKTDLSLVPNYIDLFNGIIFSGGNDLDPSSWGETYHPKCVPVDPDREKWERALLAEVERRRKPVLGICFGSQLMNVHRGGSLLQFIPDAIDTQIEHRKLDKTKEQRHPVKFDVTDSWLTRATSKRETLANSSHKQSVGKLGKGLRVIATSPDGVIEATEDPTFPLWLGVQWHPERIADEQDHHKLFQLLIAKASEQT